jgi:hypothetical protein
MSEMKRTTATTGSQETGSFRKLVERRITIDEYVKDLDRRTSELRERAGAGLAEHARLIASRSAAKH